MDNYLNGFGKNKCEHCQLYRTVEGYDGCVGKIDNVKNACCGHGDDSMAYVQFKSDNYKQNPNENRIEGEDAVAFIISKSNQKRKKIDNIKKWLDEL